MKYLITILFAVVLCYSKQTNAQFPYTLQVLHQPYTPLTGATSVTNTIWSDEYFKIPIGFKFKFNYTGDTSMVDSIYFWAGTSTPVGGPLFTTSDTGIVTIFAMLNTQLVDRGFIAQDHQRSPMRYSVTGTAGSRIFKFEIANAGSRAEYEFLNTLKDSLNMQAWFYEGSNIIEFRYGPSSVTSAYDYTFMSPAWNVPTVAYVPQFDHSDNSSMFWYLLAGNPDSATIDSIDINNAYTGYGLDTIPGNTVVYRFTPVGYVAPPPPPPGSVAQVTKSAFNVYPTMCRTEIGIDNIEGTVASYSIICVNGATTRYTGMLQKGKNVVDISNLAPGMYMLRLQNSERQSVYKFVKL